MEEKIILEGLVENIKYHNEANGYTVFDLSVDSRNFEEVVCVGYLAALNEGEAVKVKGSFVTHPTYGKQFSVDLYEKYIPTTSSGIEKYLASGAIKGIGAKLAKAIVKEFGENTLMVIEEYPERLTKIKGITVEKANTMSAIFHEHKEMMRSVIFLQQYGISPVYGAKIYKKYRENTIEAVKKNPYALADDITGIGFKIADSIAFRLGVETDSPYRIRSAIKYVLNEAAGNGHVYLPRDVLLKNTAALLYVDGEIIAHQLASMQIERTIWQEKLNDMVCVYLNFYYYAESYVAKKLLTLSMNTYKKNSDLESEIDWIEKKNGLSLAGAQRDAIRESILNGVMVLTGGPGTGKTTTVNSIIHILKKEGYEIELAAPTGRAAKRLTEATGCEAKTIHRLLGVNFSDDESRQQSFDKNENEPLETDVIILDESSMIDISLMYYLLKATPETAKLILVGDVDQLPSVGPGNVLKDIILSGRIKVVRLTEVFRQAAESAIIMNAHRINRGEYPVLNEKNKDFFFVKRNMAEDCLTAIVELATKRLPDYVKSNDMFDIQVLTPMRKSLLGVAKLNERLQEAINPPHFSKKEKEFRGILFREGDKVMQIKNNYNLSWTLNNESGKQIGEGLGIFNGDCGMIKAIDADNETIEVIFDDNKRVFYEYTQLEELELSYAVTIHKSQGSEYKVVIIPILDGPPMLMSRNLLYTAVTRAKTLAVIVGIPQTLYRMVDNNREINRFTSLSNRIGQDMMKND